MKERILCVCERQCLYNSRDHVSVCVSDFVRIFELGGGCLCVSVCVCVCVCEREREREREMFMYVCENTNDVIAITLFFTHAFPITHNNCDVTDFK